MFANTLTLTIDGVAKTLTRVNQDNYGSEYQAKTSLDMINLKIRHSTDTTAGRVFNRHNVYVEWVIYPTTTVVERVYTLTFTLRDLSKTDPEGLTDLYAGMDTLLSTLVTGLSIGEN